MKVNAIYASREPNRAAVLVEALCANQFVVTVAQKAKEVLDQLSRQNCNILLIGERLLDEDGISFVKSLRAKGPYRQIAIAAIVEHGESQPTTVQRSAYAAFGHKPVDAIRVKFAEDAEGGNVAPAPLVLGGQASMRLAFFNAGADECLSLSWDAAECLARIKALLRRMQTAPSEEIVKMGTMELNLTSYTLHVSGKKVNLTSKELDLLYVFLSSANRVLSRPYLIERVWGYNYFGSPRTVDVHVRRLREKLGPAARHITTIPCVGYKLIPPGSDDMRR
jgi:DNA-binding response OmpR family regulator